MTVHCSWSTRRREKLAQNYCLIPNFLIYCLWLNSFLRYFSIIVSSSFTHFMLTNCFVFLHTRHKLDRILVPSTYNFCCIIFRYVLSFLYCWSSFKLSFFMRPSSLYVCMHVCICHFLSLSISLFLSLSFSLSLTLILYIYFSHHLSLVL